MSTTVLSMLKMSLDALVSENGGPGQAGLY